MKKNLVLAIALGLAISVVGCTSETTSDAASDNTVAVEEVETEVEADAEAETDAETDAETEVEADADAEAVAVMSYADYVAADLDTEVVVETYVQAKQSWWEDKATVYTQDEDGAYFLYNMACSEEDYEKLVPGTKIRVTGYKSEWSGEVEITDATFEIIDGEFVAEPIDITDKLGTDELADYQNQYVKFTGLTVVAYGETEDAFSYSWDGSGTHDDNSDLYFSVTLDAEDETAEVYNFTVESYLCGNDTDVYAAVEALEVGQTIDVEGFLYWYEGANPHITSVTVK